MPIYLTTDGREVQIETDEARICTPRCSCVRAVNEALAPFSAKTGIWFNRGFIPTLARRQERYGDAAA